MEAAPALRSVLPSRSDAARRQRVREAKLRIRDSDSWKRCYSVLSALSLVSGYARPVFKAAEWGVQVAQMPGDPAAPVVARAKDVAAQMASAFATRHPLDEQPASLQPDVRACIEWQCSARAAGRSITEARDKLFADLASCSRELEWGSAELAALSPDFIQCAKPPHAHYCLFDCLGQAMSLPDDDLVDDLVIGAPAQGDCPDSGVFCAEWQPAAVGADDLAAGQAEWHRHVVSQLERAGRDPARAEEHAVLWERTQKEVRDGWAVELGSLADAHTFFRSSRDWRASIRFGVLQNGALRPCDNCKSSLLNLATALHERLTTDTADFPARAASLYAELVASAVQFAMLLGTEDIASAYRRMPCSQPWFTVFAQWDPTRVGPDGSLGAVVFFRLQGFNFGLKSAVVAFNRLSFFMTRVAVRILRVTCTSYYDDFCVAEPSFARGGQQLLRDMAALLRVPFAGACLGDGKSHAPASVNVFLGVEQDFRRFPQLRESEAGASAERLQGIVEELDRVLAGGSFAGTPGPSKLCGRLHFTISWGAGRFGNAALQPLHDACKEGRPAEIGDDLRVALKFIRAMLVDPVTGKPVQRRRRFRYAGSRSTLPTVLVWSDARWEAAQDRPAGIGFVVFFPASKAAADVAASSRTPPWLLGARTPPGRWRFAAYEPAASEYAHWRARSQYIGQLELLAAVSVYYSLAEDLRGRRVLHFIDNSGAMAGLVRDYSRDRDSAGLVHTFWALAVGLEIDVWFIFVYSEANIADWPSRGHVVFADDLGAEEVKPLRLPPQEMWGDVAAALAHAGVGPPPRKRRRGSRGGDPGAGPSGV